MLFTELDFIDRFQAAKSVGFNSVEYLFPYDFDPNQLSESLNANGLKQVLFNLPAGDWASGDRGISCIPERVNEFQQGVGTAIRYAKALGCTQVNALAGIPPVNSDPDEIKDTFVNNLKFASSQLSTHGIRLLTEPINNLDIPGFYLNYTDQANLILDLVGSDNLFIQYDIYHMQIMEGDLVRTITNNFKKIQHIQLADNPGRHEPGTGEINYQYIFRTLDKLGYQGYVGCEYIPQSGTLDGINWIKPYI